MPRGRTPKLLTKVTFEDEKGNKEELGMQEAICRLLRLGVCAETACGVVGISEASYHGWRSRGAEWAEKPEECPERERIYLQFLEATTRAQEKGIAWHEVNLRRGAEKDPRLSLEFLARRRTERYGREKTRVEHSGKIATVDEKALDERIAAVMGKVADSREAAAAGQSAD